MVARPGNPDTPLHRATAVPEPTRSRPTPALSRSTAPAPAVGTGPVRPAPADEYEGIGSFALAPLLSLACFAAALGSRWLVALLPPELRPLPRPFLSALAVPAFALLGVLLALLARRSPAARGAARLALALNAIVLALSLLLVAAFFAIYPEPLRLLRGY